MIRLRVLKPKLAFTRVRPVQQKDEVRLVGRLVNTLPDATLAGVQVLATLYDDAGTVIGLGRGYMQATTAPRGSTAWPTSTRVSVCRCRSTRIGPTASRRRGSNGSRCVVPRDFASVDTLYQTTE